MSHDHDLSRSVLYQKEDKTIVLIDIPCSISEAQGTADNRCTDVLYSSPPLDKPYPSIEPRSHKAKQAVEARLPTDNSSQQSFPQGLLAQGLAHIRAEYHGDFCFERMILPSMSMSRKRRRSKSGTPRPVGESNEESETRGGSIERGSFAQHILEPRELLILPASATLAGYEVARTLDIANSVVSNPFTRPARLTSVGSARGYRIPPLSTFMLSKVGTREAHLFSNSAYKLLPEPSMSAAPGQFDFILLDPPWDNKSARRSNRYQTRRNADEDPMEVLQNILGKHLAPGGLVSCWTTNNKVVRDTALRAFESWGVELVEEWAWLKTTVKGDPICAIDGIVRRPYEILLIGRSVDLAIPDLERPIDDEPVRYRLIVGVPDLHSRKPCLKMLVEPLMKDSSDYRALEIFARNLTAGWWSWGNEVLKYNWEGHWTTAKPR
ncbi:MAG: hypothetical protein LQ338_000429 [Usnochroma carphineum]|nr:MAG: hypothetical protein LQ338_000429 [Usnochroma carphineum]